MQQLLVKLKNTPLNASQVQSPVNLLLNKEEILSATDKVLANNNPEVNRAQQTERPLQAKVFVRNVQGEPLMPCSYAKSKRMVKKGSAKVIKRYPFTIQLKFECENKSQPVKLGIDTGFGNIGFSATTEKEELICGTLKLDGKTKERLDERRMYRRSKRARHHWYRAPRFNNRKKEEEWLPTSIQRRYDTHLNLIAKLKKLIPISTTILEIAKFDIQKIENPDIEGVEYQQGNLYEYQNVRAYLMSREKGKCQFCGKDFKGQSSHTHHIIPKHLGGNDRVNNLALVHKQCHDELHKKKLEHKLKSNSKDYKHSIFMAIINKRFWNDIPTLKVTYGNVTFVNRNELGLEKTHYNDAFVISGGTIQKRVEPFQIIQKHRNNRVLQLNRKGFKPSIKREKSKINPLDIFYIGKKSFICTGMFNKGRYIMYGTTKKKEYFRFSDVTKIFKFGSFSWNR